MSRFAVLVHFGAAVDFTRLAPCLFCIAMLVTVWSPPIVRKPPTEGARRARRLEYWREIGALVRWRCSGPGWYRRWPGAASRADGEAVLMLFSIILLGAVANAAATIPMAALPVCVAALT